MDALEQLRQAVDAILLRQADTQTRRNGFVHLYGVAGWCALLALRRGLDAQLAAAAGMLHDISAYQTGDMTDHTRRSSDLARQMLAATPAFTPPQVQQICDAILRHDEKLTTHQPLDEVLKDADLMQHYLYNPALRSRKPPTDRLLATIRELGITL
ncbi:MAG: HD domain-containing protein [Alphaproteobacteria bacterium]